MGTAAVGMDLRAANASFRRTLHAGNKSERTIEAYTDAVVDRYSKATADKRARAAYNRLGLGDRI